MAYFIREDDLAQGNQTEQQNANLYSRKASMSRYLTRYGMSKRRYRLLHKKCCKRKLPGEINVEPKPTSIQARFKHIKEDENFIHPLRVVFDETTWSDVISHSTSSLDREVMGHLVGEIYQDASGNHLQISGHIPCVEAFEERTGVRDSEQSRLHFVKTLYGKYPDLKIVGWYHTHPDFGIFLSRTDLTNIQVNFPLWYQVSLVIDPIRQQFGCYAQDSNTLKLVENISFQNSYGYNR